MKIILDRKLISLENRIFVKLKIKTVSNNKNTIQEKLFPPKINEIKKKLRVHFRDV